MSSANNAVQTISQWEPSGIKFMAPKPNKSGGKSITLLSTQTNRTLHLITPRMMTWGISDFTNDKGESDGKFSLTLNFPNPEYKTDATDEFLNKLKKFEDAILDSAVVNSQAWFGEKLERAIVKHTFNPILKYPNDKETKMVDKTKPPSIRAKVPNYEGVWKVELYDTKQNKIFPSEDPEVAPFDLVPKLSQVVCIIQCSGIWVGGKGWGITWKLIQAIVKPKEVQSLYGKCLIDMSEDDKRVIESETTPDEESDVETPAKNVEQSTHADDSDAEDNTPPPAPVETKTSTPAKKVVAKKPVVESVAPVEEPAPAPVETKPATVKKVVKKVVAKA